MISTNFPHLEAKKTPFYFYDLSVLSNTLEELLKTAKVHNYKVHYAMKANANIKILEKIHSYGFGVDCVSGNEIKRALSIGFSADDIVFAGVGKTEEEIIHALRVGISCFNCESVEELMVIQELAKEYNTIAKVALRLNPNIDALTHKYITTGKTENKFGIRSEDIPRIAKELEGDMYVKIVGLHFHIGSQITSLSVFKALCKKVNAIHKQCNSYGLNFEHINVGGGLGVDYSNPDDNMIPDFEAYFKVFNEGISLKDNQQLHFELGRSIVAQCGLLVSKVLYVKKSEHNNFAILDAGMTDLLRPALYNSSHKIENISKQEQTSNLLNYDVVGPICESSDSFGKNIELPKTERNDLIAIRTVGAYGEVMASQYNLRSLPQAYYSEI